jgi:hypothetical protein
MFTRWAESSRFSSMSVEKELAQATGQAQTAGLTDGRH